MRSPLALLCLLAAAPALAEDAQPTADAPPPVPVISYQLSKDSSLFIQVFKDPEALGQAAAHDHAIRSTTHSGKLSWKADDPSACQLQITVPVAGLDPDPPDLRKQVGYDTMLDDGDRKKVGENMRAKDQLDGAQFPEIRFESTSCTGSGDKVQVAGKLTIHGVTKTVSLPMKVKATDQSLELSGSVKIKATDYGFEPYEALLGAVRNLNEMKLTVTLKGTAP